MKTMVSGNTISSRSRCTCLGLFVALAAALAQPLQAQVDNKIYHDIAGSGVNQPVWWIENSSVYGYSGYFDITSASNYYPALVGVTSGTGQGVLGVANSASGYGVWGRSTNGYGGVFSGGTEGVYATGGTYGVYGFSPSYYGVVGECSAYGMYGGYFDDNNGNGVYGSSTSGDGGDFYGGNIGVFGYSSGGYGVYGATNNGYAGYFSGDVYVNGTISAGAKNFKIDHPLDPANKYLVHTCVESDQMINLYRGNVVLDANGHAVVAVPDWFEALNKNVSYQLTCVGGYAPVYIATELHKGAFGIAGGKPGLKVCWQITGERQDAYAKAHPLEVEQNKPEDKRGNYLHPKEHGMPEEMGEDYEMRQRHSHHSPLVQRK